MTSPATGFFHLKDNDTPPDRDQWWTAGAHEEGIFGSAGSQLSVPGGSSAPPARVSPRNSLDYSGGSNWFRGISSFTGAAAGNRSQLTASLLVDNEAQRQAGGSSSRGTARQLSVRCRHGRCLSAADNPSTAIIGLAPLLDDSPVSAAARQAGRR